MSSELPLHADLVFWLYNVLHCLAVCLAVPLHQDSKICNTVQSITKRKLHWQNFSKHIATFLMLEIVYDTPGSENVKKNVFYSYFKRQSIYQGMQPSKLDMWKGLGLDNDNCNSISLSRVWTDFWIQNSRFFPDFFQNNNFFFQTHSYQIGEQKRP